MYSSIDKLDDGYIFVANQYIGRKQTDMGIHFLKEALKVKPESFDVHFLLSEHANGQSAKIKYLNSAATVATKASEHNKLGNQYYSVKYLLQALKHFKKAYNLDKSLTDALANGIYIKTNLCIWGKNGTSFDEDVEILKSIVEHEMETSMLDINNISQTSAIHPHMSLAYPIPVPYKLAIAKSHANGEKLLIVNHGVKSYNHTKLIPSYLAESNRPGFRIKVGYISASFKSKAIIYLTQDLMRFHNREKFEIHI
jgi:predicted O-linked N-acetylglucosamine transferase (SPINDLY family)